MDDAGKKHPPVVQRHSEIFGVLKRLAVDEVSAEVAYTQIVEIVQAYLPRGPCEGHGEIVGDLIYCVLAGHPAGLTPAQDADIWRTLREVPASPLAAARGVLEISLTFWLFDDPEVGVGAGKLYKQYLTQFYPPSPYYLKTVFPTVRKRIDFGCEL